MGLWTVRGGRGGRTLDPRLMARVAARWSSTAIALVGLLVSLAVLMAHRSGTGIEKPRREKSEEPRAQRPARTFAPEVPISAREDPVYDAARAAADSAVMEVSHSCEFVVDVCRGFAAGANALECQWLPSDVLALSHWVTPEGRCTTGLILFPGAGRSD